MRPPGWIVGVSVAAATLYLVMNTRLMAGGMFGLLVVPAIAMWAGAAAASIVDVRHTRRNTAVVICAVMALFLGHLAIVMNRPLPPGSSAGGMNVYPAQGGANVDPSKGGPSVYPP